MTPAFWEGRRVLVTGHTGFKGSWLALWLSSLKARVTGLALDPPTSPSLYEASGVARTIASHKGDVRDPAALERAFGESRPEVVFHLAAQSLVRRSYREPVETFGTNVMGTVHCLEAARRAPGVRAVVIVTTDKCYRNDGTRRRYRESDALGGDDPYAASKACAEFVTHAYRTSFSDGQALVASARAGNVIGGGDWAADRLVPDAVRAFAAGRALEVRHPEATRPWQHVLEPLNGYLTLAERLHAGDRTAARGWNFGPAQTEVRSVRWIADGLARRWGGGAQWRTAPRGADPKEALELGLDSSLAEAQLGWRAVLPLHEGLDWIVEWHKAHAKGADAAVLTREQLQRYQQRCCQ